MIINLYIDLLAGIAVRSPTSAAPAPQPDFRDPTVHTLNVYFLQRTDAITENYSYIRFSSGVLTAKLRRNKAPDYCTFVLDFVGSESQPIDARLPAQSIATLIGKMPSVGIGNINVVGDYVNGFTAEFINEQANCAQPLLTGRVITPATGELVIASIVAGEPGIVGSPGTNAIQSFKLREGPLTIATGWTEIGVPATPGWSASIDTTAVPQSMWDDGTLILEIGMDVQGVRTGTDGATVLEGSGRTGANGQVVAAAAIAGVTSLPTQDDQGNCFLVAMNGSNVYGRIFSASDVGRTVTDVAGFLVPGTKIKSVTITPYYNAAIIDTPFNPALIVTPPVPITFTIGSYPSTVYKSATAAFTANDIGHGISGDKLVAGTTIVQVLDAQTVQLSQLPTGIGTGLNWTIAALPNNLYNSASAAFASSDVGAQLDSAQLPAGTTIVTVNSSTQVILSQNALGVATGLAWTLRPAKGFPGAIVSSIRTGSLTISDIQQITLTQFPIGGSIALRDGADISLPWATVLCPLSAPAIKNALHQVYPNFGDVQVTEIVPDGQYQIQWGVLGQQHLLVVDDTQAIYPVQVTVVPVGAQLNATATSPALVPPSFAIPGVSQFLNVGVYLMGVPNASWSSWSKYPQVRQVADGTFGYELRVFYIQVQGTFVTPAIGSQISWSGLTFYHDHVEDYEDRASLTYYTWVGYSIPPPRTELVPINKSLYAPLTQTLNGRVVDLQLASASQSTWGHAYYTYWASPRTNAGGNNGLATPSDGPFGAVVHFSAVGGFSGVYALWTGGGFSSTYGTTGRGFVLSWSRRRWKSYIWEQVQIADV